MKKLAFLLLITVSMASEDDGIGASTPGRDEAKKSAGSVIQPETKGEAEPLSKVQLHLPEAAKQEIIKKMVARDVLYSA